MKRRSTISLLGGATVGGLDEWRGLRVYHYGAVVLHDDSVIVGVLHGTDPIGFYGYFGVDVDGTETVKAIGAFSAKQVFDLGYSFDGDVPLTEPHVGEHIVYTCTRPSCCPSAAAIHGRGNHE